LSLSFFWSSGFLSCPGFPACHDSHDRSVPRPGRARTRPPTRKIAGESSLCQSLNTLVRSARRPLKNWCWARTSPRPRARIADGRRRHSSFPHSPLPEPQPGPRAPHARPRAVVEGSNGGRFALHLRKSNWQMLTRKATSKVRPKLWGGRIAGDCSSQLQN
jgi:hypothetical protein